MKRILNVCEDLCTGCGMCEMACSLQKTGQFGPFKAGIRALKDDYKEEIKVIICRQCKKAPCVEACPVEGEKPLTRDKETDAVIFNGERCIECYECVRACPFGAIWIDPESGRLEKCDLCGGEPECVNWCVTGAISFVQPHEISIKRVAGRGEKEKIGLTKLDLGTIHIEHYIKG